MGKMPSRTIAIAADHGGYDLKGSLKEALEGMGYDVLDLGADGPEPVDYPDFADAMAAALGGGRAERGVLICGSGIGISIAANRHRHVRAALCHSIEAAQLARRHNDANVMAVGARLTDVEMAKDMLFVFLETDFEAGRHLQRVTKLG
jgi:ribose 5-phosphate isomerase B